jgi:hypothetical protein
LRLAERNLENAIARRVLVAVNVEIALVQLGQIQKILTFGDALQF